MAAPKGNKYSPGRTIGAKSKKTLEWEALAESITGLQAGYFNQYIQDLWHSDLSKDKEKAADLFLTTLEYFKPKLQRSNVDLTSGGEPIRTPNIIIPGPETQP